MKLFTSEGELLSFDKLDERLEVIQAPYDNYTAKNSNENITILLQEIRRRYYDLYLAIFDLEKEQEFSLEVNKRGKCFCYPLNQQVRVELDWKAIITIAKKRFNILPIRSCKISIPKGTSAYILIRIPQKIKLFDARFELPFFYSKQGDRIRWAADSYREDDITNTLGSFILETLLKKEGLKKLDKKILTIIVCSWKHIISTGMGYEN